MNVVPVGLLGVENGAAPGSGFSENIRVVYLFGNPGDGFAWYGKCWRAPGKYVCAI